MAHTPLSAACRPAGAMPGCHASARDFLAGDADLDRCADDRDALDRDAGRKRLSWRYGIGHNVRDRMLRASGVASRIDFQVPS